MKTDVNSNHIFISFRTNLTFLSSFTNILQKDFKIKISKTGYFFDQASSENIRNSDLFICFIEKTYCDSSECTDELLYTKSRALIMIITMNQF